jgi:hypothetical protein
MKYLLVVMAAFLTPLSAQGQGFDAPIASQQFDIPIDGLDKSHSEELKGTTGQTPPRRSLRKRAGKNMVKRLATLTKAASSLARTP